MNTVSLCMISRVPRDLGTILHSDVMVTHRPVGGHSARNLRIYERRWQGFSVSNS